MEDALSKKDEDVKALIYVISIIKLDWITEARDEWKNDEEIWAFIQKMQQDPSASSTFRWKDDLIWYTNRIYLGKSS